MSASPELRDVVDAYLKTDAAKANVPRDWVTTLLFVRARKSPAR